MIPQAVCHPAPYGSATCLSDYDVGLVGPKSGELTGDFNDAFQEEFGKASEEVFDNNTGYPKKVLVKNFYSDLFTASIHSF